MIFFIEIFMLLQTPTPLTAPSTSNSEFWQMVSALAATVTVGLGIITIILTFRSSQLKERLKRFEAHVKLVLNLEYEYQNVVFIGPRYSGKTSVAELWAKPWTDIQEMTASSEWKEYEFNVFEHDDTYCQFDTYLSVERTYKKILRLKMLVYPGEDRYRQEAIQKLPKMKNTVLVLFFEIEANESEIINTNKNNSYYSKFFLETVDAQKGITNSLSKVIVVFNKTDLLPSVIEFNTAKEQLCQINRDALNRIDSLFGGQIEHYYVSAKDNKKLITLLGTIGAIGLPEKERQAFYEKMRRIADDVR